MDADVESRMTRLERVVRDADERGRAAEDLQGRKIAVCEKKLEDTGKTLEALSNQLAEICTLRRRIQHGFWVASFLVAVLSLLGVRDYLKHNGVEVLRLVIGVDRHVDSALRRLVAYADQHVFDLSLQRNATYTIRFFGWQEETLDLDCEARPVGTAPVGDYLVTVKLDGSVLTDPEYSMADLKEPGLEFERQLKKPAVAGVEHEDALTLIRGPRRLVANPWMHRVEIGLARKPGLSPNAEDGPEVFVVDCLVRVIGKAEWANFRDATALVAGELH